MISAPWFNAYSIAAIIPEILPWPLLSIARIDNIFAFGFCSKIDFTISLPWPFPSNDLSITETLFVILSLSEAPVSINAINFVLLSIIVDSFSSYMKFIGFVSSFIDVWLHSSANNSSLAAEIIASGSTANPASVYFTYAFIASSTVSYWIR